ncbi:hypothetical protein ACQEVY_05290 [Streptomyces sp. CA-288835]|uniref:hypothetical protein n=1 Tax=Streptomyces sp. CA-288835 TaxID=3240069 RepID=UPI003D9313AC
MAVFTAADHPLRARQVYEAMDVAVAPNNINNVRLKLKRLVPPQLLDLFDDIGWGLGR